ncbi:MAG: hypothetical protein CMB18_02655 [Euryarchaeota archaeon]|nr:hypothetical protein [Euryarchaeota archaeon]
MVSYTRLLLVVLLLVGTPLFLLFVGSMNLGQKIAASTVLIAFFALFIFSGRKPLPPVPKTQVVVEENQEELEEEQPIATEVEVQADEQVTRSRGRVAAPLTPQMPSPMPAPNPPPMPAPGMSIPPPLPPEIPPMAVDGGTVAKRFVVTNDAQSEMETEIETYVEEQREKRAVIRGKIERRRRMALAERKAAKVRMWTELEDGEDLGALLDNPNHGLIVIEEDESPDDSSPLGVSYVRIDESRILKIRVPLKIPEKAVSKPVEEFSMVEDMPPMPPPPSGLPPMPPPSGMPPPPPPE